MADESWTYEPRSKPYRRRLKRVGLQEQAEALTDGQMPNAMEEAKRADRGPYCQGCHKFLRWADCNTKYETTDRIIYRVRFHRVCGAMVEETNMTERM